MQTTPFQTKCMFGWANVLRKEYNELALSIMILQLLLLYMQNSCEQYLLYVLDV